MRGRQGVPTVRYQKLVGAGAKSCPREVNVPEFRGFGIFSRDPRVTRTQALDDFAASLCMGQVQAIARSDRHIEGNVWLILLLSDAYVALDDMVHSTDQIERGWWVVKAKYYFLKQRSPRGYLLREEERVLVVNHMVCLPKRVEFAPLLQTPRLEVQSTNPLRILYYKEYRGVAYLSTRVLNIIQPEV